ncbi:MAG: KamA family radical SAM protein [Ignavibacteriota bacterium]|jgi:lysine 2,3-aminomutase|nr:MAG: KamA family radical SAM protein [Ignavibacterium sp.]MBL1154817.1 KamA family radical SAM protein [Ignavibacteriota bacterium]MCO6448271.1 KamA family radical SAM protein [Ignavibacterium album]MCZ2268567.1 KamA family radical SAM protein [Ignavibacteriales bacterium]MDX9713465.1 KamA family radical SAM protein [Ignavibacteriaceae bacterium]
MELWQQMVRDSVHTVEQLVEKFGIDKKVAEDLDEFFQARINPYYFNLIRYPGDPIWRQCVPDKTELEDFDAAEDPLMEDAMSPVPNITHRYPDRALFLVTSQCGLYCRFCTRKRKVGDYEKISMRGLESAFNYLEQHTEIRDVILSGGDPLMLTDAMLEKILQRIRKIPHIEIIRLGSRMPCVLPHRITTKLVNMLKKYHPIYCNTHFNHPWEITPESSKACQMMADAGIPMGNQTVIMKGVNDDPAVMKELVQKLLKIRVRPYYMYMADETKGANHFRTSIETGISIVEALRGHTSGLAVPHFVIDAPGGGGKIPLLPNYVLHKDEERIILRNFQNKVYTYKNYQDANNPNGYGSKNKVNGKNGKNGSNGNGNGKGKKEDLKPKRIKLPVLEEVTN